MYDFSAIFRHKKLDIYLIHSSSIYSVLYSCLYTSIVSVLVTKGKGMRIHYSDYWEGWQAQEVVNGELVTIINRESREGAIESLIKRVYEIKNLQRA